MSIFDESLRVRQIDIGGSSFGIDHFNHSGATTLVGIQTCVEDAVCVFEHTAAVKFEALDASLVTGVGGANFGFGLQLGGTELKLGLCSSSASSLHFTLIAKTRDRDIHGKAEAKDIVYGLEEVAGSYTCVRE